LEKYGARDGGKLARVIFANICYQAERPERAIELYEAALDDFRSHPFYCNLILTSLGYAHRQQKNLQQAVAYFRQVAEGPESSLKDEALFNLGQLYAQLGDTALSTAAYEKLVSDFPDSIYLELAREKLAG
jgi:tetratricopeptide (TPR) repeat protein